ncbi:MAG: nicotinate phosphoribosyltransferase [Rhizobiales bacterium]|nr:nicotinate phosphoribosyltransferase [Hyphomicrobiales bacterium]NRB13571.1 nicotinate phosphoribosyltransferase [Hyphomicrobiales bacterium]
MDFNFILAADSYKTSHYQQYPPHTNIVSSYIESRGGEHPKVLFFGLQMFVEQYLTKPISQADIDEAEDIITAHGLPFNREGWEYILHQHGGYMPLEIQALKEGSFFPFRNVIVQVRNTDPKCFWLTSYIETSLLRAIWYPTTVATRSHYIYQTIKKYLELTADNLDGLPFKLHDFGARGASSLESAAIGGLAHLVNFMGSDTMASLIYGRKFYDIDMAGFSIPAAEHSTITTWGRGAEKAAYENMIDQFATEGKMVAVVSDSYNLWHAIDQIWGDELKQKVIDSGGTIIIRPDSGEPVEIVTETVIKLMDKFGFSYNEKGFKILPDYIRVIQGDGVSAPIIEQILERLYQLKISADNLAFGMGAELLQKLDRDSQQFAMKVSAADIDGVWYDIYKDPITDHHKQSKRGRFAVIKSGKDSCLTISERSLGSNENLLETVYLDGKLMRRQSFAEIRKLALG